MDIYEASTRVPCGYCRDEVKERCKLKVGATYCYMASNVCYSFTWLVLLLDFNIRFLVSFKVTEQNL